MKKVIFDIDGVLLSEERYFDVSGLVVWEWLYGKKYMSLPSEQDDFDGSCVNEGQIAAIRNKVWGKDYLLKWLKSKGINSNWDMVHAYLVTLIWLMAKIYQQRSDGERLSLSFRNEQDVKKAGEMLMGIPVPTADLILEQWKSWISEESKGNEVMICLGEKASRGWGNNGEWAFQFSEFYRLHVELFQAWYLGDDVFIHKNHTLPYSGNKEGFLSKEIALAGADTICYMFRELKKRGYEIGIATGRVREEMEIPLKKFGWYQEFNPQYIGTASDADTASRKWQGIFLDKPHPFIYLCGIFGRDKSNYQSYIDGGRMVTDEDEIYVCGDSYADLLGAEKAGANFIGVSSGLEGDQLSQRCKERGFPIVKGVLDVLDLLK